MKIPYLLFAALPVAAQISGPQLGYVSHRGEIRRIEGLAYTSRLSEPLAGLPACSRVDASTSRFAFCTSSEGVTLIDLQTVAATRSFDAYQRIVWSPNGLSVALDSQVHDLIHAKSNRVTEAVVAVSDTGSTAVRDAQGSLRLGNEIVAGPEAGAAAFDGEALLVAAGPSMRRIDPGRSNQVYPLAFEPAFLAADAAAFYAASARTIARIDRATGAVTEYDVPSDDVRIERLDRLSGGAWLLSGPGENQPGWLFRDGRFSFIPGATRQEEAGQ